MKQIKLLALLVCASAMLMGGCKTCDSCATKTACGHQCCADNHTDCAHCPVCTAKK